LPLFNPIDKGVVMKRKCSIIKTIPSNLGDIVKLAELADITLVKLRHPNGYGNVPATMRGFQGGVIELIDIRGKKEYKFTPERDRHGDDIPTPRDLVFIPDNDTGELIAYIPDTPYNRDVLAKIIGDYAPTILEPDEVRGAVEIRRRELRIGASDVGFGLKYNFTKAQLDNAYASEIFSEEEKQADLIAAWSESFGDKFRREKDYFMKFVKPVVERVNTGLLNAGVKESRLRTAEEVWNIVKRK
jgi:hypothetical protein